jgi:hypothetical protein
MDSVLNNKFKILHVIENFNLEIKRHVSGQIAFMHKIEYI